MGGSPHPVSAGLPVIEEAIPSPLRRMSLACAPRGGHFYRGTRRKQHGERTLMRRLRYAGFRVDSAFSGTVKKG